MARVTLRSGRAFEAEPGESILDAAERAGVVLPHSCGTGRCSTCRCRIVEGVTEPLQREVGLTPEEIADGWVLSCVRTPVGDVRVAIDDLTGLSLSVPKTFPCRIDAIDDLAPGVRRVRLRLPRTADFDHLPGQHVEIANKAGIRRSYSLANRRIPFGTLEIHVREVEGGAMSAYWFAEAKVDDLLWLEGPHGTFVLRDEAGADVVFLATGTGIGPIKAMLEGIAALDPAARPASVTVFWGGRTPEDLYWDPRAALPDITYVPTLSRAGPDWTGRRGHVQQAFLDTTLVVERSRVYACGSEAMIREAEATLVAAGLPATAFFADAFVASS